MGGYPSGYPPGITWNRLIKELLIFDRTGRTKCETNRETTCPPQKAKKKSLKNLSEIRQPQRE
jgi:hypothetical protein